MIHGSSLSKSWTCPIRTCVARRAKRSSCCEAALHGRNTRRRSRPVSHTARRCSAGKAGARQSVCVSGKTCLTSRKFRGNPIEVASSPTHNPHYHNTHTHTTSHSLAHCNGSVQRRKIVSTEAEPLLGSVELDIILIIMTNAFATPSRDTIHPPS